MSPHSDAEALQRRLVEFMRSPEFESLTTAEAMRRWSEISAAFLSERR